MALTWWMIVMAIAAVAVVLWQFGAGRLTKPLEQAMRTGEIAGVLAAVESASPKEQPTLWDHAIGELWKSYHRETAISLIREAATRSDADIVQYWVRQAMEVEPEIASQVFSPEFLEAYFKPDVAARCGRKGCCG
ncbi:hypothetical protein DL240_03620 [Lujinxingia litoralis]|uniref:HEAT repeat domain-containing protein n=1 Tax=Lujinxingia litoralis TaxID=2211119 RepID=A0A328CD84_9DELT|nr:hypothetical protein [Lujinxingia litoralis]RAL25311.1 hypothetical protein DL240_03620 [Lujinxingia litoralis]